MTLRRSWGLREAEPDVVIPVAPTICPFCRSAALTPPPKRVDASTYWRCGSCGEIWNTARLQMNPSRYRRGW